MNETRRHWLLATMAAAAAATAGTAGAQGAELTVGVFNATTGVYAFGGVPIQNAMRLAIEQANKQGLPGGARIKIVEGDTAGDKAQTITLINQFARRDNAILLLGPTTSVEAVSGAPVSNALQIPMISTSSSAEILDAGPWSFKVGAQATQTTGRLGRYAVEKLGVKRALMVFDQGNEGYIAQKNAMRDALKSSGAQILADEGIQASDSNFLPLATKIAAQDVDAVFIAAPAELSANFFIQLLQAGVSPKTRFMGPASLASQGFIKSGGKAVENAYVVADYAATSANPVNAAFTEAYKARYGTAPDNWAAMGYSTALIGIQAIRNAGPNPDRAKVRAELAKSNKVPVVIGDGLWTLDAGRQPSYGAAILQVKNGAFVSAP
ncbi:ABC transporter substrate-binding protein [Variovorax soli]|uniref:Branched-chain amino acid transport system substrate-binding protein n=1 Tax=Variovorax soli TaxID=376815 RepID=A0ABU1NJ66_9BURK|nr:ABC transporter substrate-binding protein [Variovorax soli]MDR6538504.1 branched-chain amino acid transport system substrate-binding protein [Variovorax soli]